MQAIPDKREAGATRARAFAERLWLFLRRRWLMLAMAAILFFLFRQASTDEIIHTFVNVSWGWVSLAVFANLVSIMLKVASWKVIFDSSFDKVRGRWIDLTSALMVGFLVNLVIPARVGELARAFVITRRQGLRGQPVSSSTVLGTIVLERVFDGIAMAMIIIYGVTHMNLPVWADRGAVVLVVVSILFSSALIFLESSRERLQARVADDGNREEPRRWRRRQFVRFRGIVARFSDGQRVLRKPGRVVLVCSTTAGSWLTQLLAVFFTLHAFHIGLAGMMGALMLLILMNIAGVLPATPGNVGIFQLATVLPLTVAYDEITYSSALAFSIGLQIIEGSIGAGLGSICLIREGLSFNQVKQGSMRELGEPETLPSAGAVAEPALMNEPAVQGEPAPQLTRAGG